MSVEELTEQGTTVSSSLGVHLRRAWERLTEEFVEGEWWRSRSSGEIKLRWSACPVNPGLSQLDL